MPRQSRSKCFRRPSKIAGVSFTADEQQAHSRETERRARLCRGIRAAASREPRQHAAGDRLQSGPAREDASDRAAASTRQRIDVSMPRSDEQLALLPLTHLARLVESRQVKPSELTKLYLARLEETRSAASLRRQSHRGARASPGEAGRRRNRGGNVPRAAARHPLGTERSSWRSAERRRPGGCRRSRIASSTPTPRSTAGDEGGSDPRRQAVDRRARRQRAVVWRTHAKPVEHRAGRRGLLGRSRLGDGGGAGRLFHRDRYGRVDYPAVDAKRRQRPASDVWPRQPLRRHDARLDAGHHRPDVPLVRRLRARVRRHPGTRRQGQHAARRALQLGRVSGRVAPARRLHASRRGARRERGTGQAEPRGRVRCHPLAGRFPRAVRVARRSD